MKVNDEKLQDLDPGSGSGSISQRHGSADPGPDPHQNVMDLEHWSDHSSNSSEASHTVPWVSFIWIRIWIANPELGESISNAKSKNVLYFKLIGVYTFHY